MTVSLSTIIPIRNRSGARLRNCLLSLRWQQIEPSDHEVIISDYGSVPEHSTSIDALAEQLGARVIRTTTDGTWNKSHALNIGIQAAHGEFVLCTDVDMMFQDNFLTTLLSTHRSCPGDVMVHCRCFDLPRQLPEREWTSADFEQLRSRAINRPTMATGACQSARREFFERVRGYDEQFRHWGYEDLDMTWRARHSGLEIRWVSDRTAMLHQWHPTVRQEHPWARWTNCWRYRLTRHIVVKNRKRWGLID